MAGKKWTQEEVQFISDNLKNKRNPTDPLVLEELNSTFGNARTIPSINGLLQTRGWNVRGCEKKGNGLPRINWKETRQRDTWVIDCKNDSRIRNVDDAIKKAGVDMVIWEVDRVEVNGWDVTMKIKNKGEEKPFRSQNQQIRITLKRKVPVDVENAVENLLKTLAKKSRKVPKKNILRIDTPRAFEVCLMDPHYGLRCFPEGADVAWSPQLCADMVLDTLDELIRLSKAYGKMEQVFLPIGNDFFHIDTIWSETTAHTLQPEADSYLNTFIGGEALAVEIIERLKQVANTIYIYAIFGNHDRTTSFMLGRILRAYYHNDKNIIVHADAAPYKFHRYGLNLIGYDHGHSVKPIRLAALMANEVPEWWAATKNGYREWHLGDQHRKGVMNPIMFEEQGVSVEYLPGLTAPNEWHKLKSFNWQKRGSMAFIWDKKAGPIARLQVNIDRYLNCLMGSKK